MCGITGIVGIDRSLLNKMLETMRHRGPDATGQIDLSELGCTLGHTRLSIIDLDPRSNQPFVSGCDRYVITFNGEIYNYLELRAELERLGYTFRTKSDTEVLLNLLIEFGISGINRVEGMFAFCFADIQARKLLLARDQIGEKPLYYSFFKGAEPGFAFASEIKGLLVNPSVDTSLDEEGLADYLRFLYTAAPRTLYRGIRELPPGHYLELDIDNLTDNPRRYFSLSDNSPGYQDMGYDEVVETFHELFLESIRLRLRSDVPVSVYLSGGLDSNAILGAAKEAAADTNLDTFTIRYSGSTLARSFDESELAARAASEQNVPNTQIVFSEDERFIETVERMVDLFDQPFGNATAVVADKMAAGVSAKCRVALVGDGGDEILVGYPRYKALPLYKRFQMLPLSVRRLLASALSGLPEHGRSATRIRRVKQFTAGLAHPLAESFLNWSTYINSETLRTALGEEVITPFYSGLLDKFTGFADDPVRAAALVDLQSFVPFNLMQSADRTSMAHSLELRCPFLSPKLIKFALQVQTGHKLTRGRNKPLLVDAFSGIIPKFIANQPKRAFNPPIQGVIRRNLDLLEDYLKGPGSRVSKVLTDKFLTAEMEAFRSGRRDNSTLLWGLASLECWMRRN